MLPSWKMPSSTPSTISTAWSSRTGAAAATPPSRPRPSSTCRSGAMPRRWRWAHATSRSSGCARMARLRGSSWSPARASRLPPARIRAPWSTSSPMRSPIACCTYRPPRCATPPHAATSTCCAPSNPCCHPSLPTTMLPTLRRKLEALAERRDELERLLADPAIAGDQSRFRALSREFSRLAPLATALAEEGRARADLAAAEAMRGDAELRELAEEEIAAAQARLAALDDTLMALLVPRDARDDGGLYLEIRAGTGGDEAAIFAGDLLRMYTRYAERQGWRVEVESASPGEHGGFREVIARVDGEGAYARLKFESGAHRVQRVPETESQGRIHTSAATVAIIPVEAEGEPIEINPADLRVDTFRSSGAGGQHVNKTDSAIRITHLPSGVVVESQTERSQHANRDKAMKRLRATLADAEAARRAAATAATRKLQVGS